MAERHSRNKLGWARKSHRELCGKWECKQEGLNQGCDYTEERERVDLAAPGTWEE